MTEYKRVPLGEGDCHAEKQMAIFLQSGYSGAFVVENSLPTDLLVKDSNFTNPMLTD